MTRPLRAERCASVAMALGLVACVDEPPGLPQTTAQVDGGSASTGMSSAEATSVGSGTSSEATQGSGPDGTTGPATCGNGAHDEGEDCDGVDLQGETCESLGLLGGTLACAADCTFDIGGCITCGNGAVDDGEDCDGNDLGGQTCESVGFSGVGLACVECQLDASSCGPMPGMVDVPAGVFTMGSMPGVGEDDEGPQRQVNVDRFWMDEHDVTVADYESCVTDGACTSPDTGQNCNWTVPGRENHPINCVDWSQAGSFCAWAGGGTKRLPTEAEWEKAARGTDARTYPWGNGPDANCTYTVMNDAAAGGFGCGNDSTMMVGSKPMGMSPYGAQDMAGNVYNWVADWYAPYDPMDTDNPTGPAAGTERVTKGGSWNNADPSNFRPARRRETLPDDRPSRGGIRCARTPPAAP